MSNIPVTLQINSQDSEIYIGSEKIALPNPNPYHEFWYYGVDLRNPTGPAVFNLLDKSNTEVPSEVSAHENDENVLLCFMFANTPTSYLPQGSLYTFLREAGAGPVLARTEQMAEQSGSSIFGFPNYGLAATMLTSDEPGFEAVGYFNPGYLTFQLMPVVIDHNTVYSPVQVA
ncbi:MAG: hypothetical protein KDK04_20715 [Candidatus Competibacteraceae bacterium]|nr:hypothetical protein [Candidatus Competibacteraceae bacterium]MCB1814117.1 hypothetical protein [Candidatus Competibacteraceae bacterium]